MQDGRVGFVRWVLEEGNRKGPGLIQSPAIARGDSAAVYCTQSLHLNRIVADLKVAEWKVNENLSCDG
jgi:hypothetical protein